jgi:hypothetical protein
MHILLWFSFNRGVMPFSQRKRMLEKSRCRKKKTKEATAANSASEITMGATVCLRSTPIFNAGSVAFTYVNGTPKVSSSLLSRSLTLSLHTFYKWLPSWVGMCCKAWQDSVCYQIFSQTRPHI